MYRIAIVEDKGEEAAALRSHLSRYAREKDLELRISWFKTAWDFNDSQAAYDLVFMDIGLPGISGMEAAQQMRLKDTETPIIFVTSLSQYAARGYEVQALDFIVKPVEYYAFMMRMDRALRVLRRNSPRKILVKSGEGLRVIPLDELLYIEVRNHDLTYHLTAANEFPTIVVRGSLNKVEQELSSGPFVRVSSSHLVNMNHIRLIKGSDLLLVNGETIQFSRPRRHEAVQRITAYLGGGI